ncbi:MAG: 3-methylfumaryl-CoA hydratase [Pseudohongiellaceae bacterium]|jgi:3-methylfumaryl-CoA hydratase
MPNTDLTEKDLQQWLGKSQHHEDVLYPGPAHLLAATLDRDHVQFAQGDTLPILWHWLYFLSAERLSSLAPDGHPTKGGFLPPIPLPRRMWAGSRLRFQQPLCLAQRVKKSSTIKSIQFKAGRSGQLAFVCVVHEISNAAGVAVIEEQDLVYRSPALPSALPPAPLKSSVVADFSLSVAPSAVMLFRYSALTFNAHRIHYDRDYAMAEEGYPGLVVHGPLLATLMMELVAGEFVGRPVLSFEFRALQPVFEGAEIKVCGKLPDGDGKGELWIENGVGEVCMRGLLVLG